MIVNYYNFIYFTLFYASFFNPIFCIKAFAGSLRYATFTIFELLTLRPRNTYIYVFAALSGFFNF